MAKLKLQPNPTFTHLINIPVPGSVEGGDVVFTFKAKTFKELSDFADNVAHYESDTDMVMDIAAGWDLEESFTRENVETLLENYPGAGLRILNGYLDEHGKARLGN